MLSLYPTLKVTLRIHIRVEQSYWKLQARNKSEISEHSHTERIAEKALPSHCNSNSILGRPLLCDLYKCCIKRHFCLIDKKRSSSITLCQCVFPHFHAGDENPSNSSNWFVPRADDDKKRNRIVCTSIFSSFYTSAAMGKTEKHLNGKSDVSQPAGFLFLR